MIKNYFKHSHAFPYSQYIRHENKGFGSCSLFLHYYDFVMCALLIVFTSKQIYINLDYYNDEDYVNFDMIEGLQ